MQEPQQHTSPTQPFPVGDALVPQSIDMAPEGFDLVNEGKIFTPFTKHPAVWKPLAAVNWPPSSYDPETHLMYICATDSLWGATGGDPNYPVEPGALYSGSVVARFAGAAARRVRRHRCHDEQARMAPAMGRSVLQRLDRHRRRARVRRAQRRQADGARQIQRPQTVGVSDGRRRERARVDVRVQGQAVRRRAGRRHRARRQQAQRRPVVVLPRRDDELAAARARRIPRHSAARRTSGCAPAAPAALPPAAAANLDKGKEIYTTTCVVCHGENGKGGSHGGAPLTPALTARRSPTSSRRGRNDMPPFGSALTPQQLNDLAAYVSADLQRRTEEKNGDGRIPPRVLLWSLCEHACDDTSRRR